MRQSQGWTGAFWAKTGQPSWRSRGRSAILRRPKFASPGQSPLKDWDLFVSLVGLLRILVIELSWNSLETTLKEWKGMGLLTVPWVKTQNHVLTAWKEERQQNILVRLGGPLVVLIGDCYLAVKEAPCLGRHALFPFSTFCYECKPRPMIQEVIIIVYWSIIVCWNLVIVSHYYCKSTGVYKGLFKNCAVFFVKHLSFLAHFNFSL